MWSQKPPEDDLSSGKTRSKFSMFGGSKPKKEDSKSSSKSKTKRSEEEEVAAESVVVVMEEEVEKPEKGKYRQPPNDSWRRDPSPPFHRLLVEEDSGKITTDLARQIAEQKPRYSEGVINRGSRIRPSNVVNVINFVSNNIKNDSLRNSKDFKAKLVALAYQQMQTSQAPTVNNLLIQVNSAEVEIEQQPLTVYTQ